MKKLFYEFFYIPKHGKIRDKVMLTRVITTVAVIVSCLVIMSVTAYAYFSYNITSGSNIIKTAHFETNVSIQITDENGEAVEIQAITKNHMNKVKLDAWKTYIVKITPTENNTAKTGFVVVSAEGCKEIYHTQQLGLDEGAAGGKTDSITFELVLTDATEVEFLSHWGTSSYYAEYKDKGDSEALYITQNEKIKMIINGKENPPSAGKNEQSEEETPDDEAPPKQPAASETPDAEKGEPQNESGSSEEPAASEDTASGETAPPDAESQNTEEQDTSDSTTPLDSPEANDSADAPTDGEGE